MILRIKILSLLILTAGIFIIYLKMSWIPEYTGDVEKQYLRSMESGLKFIGNSFVAPLLDNNLSQVFSTLDDLTSENDAWIALLLLDHNNKTIYQSSEVTQNKNDVQVDFSAQKMAFQYKEMVYPIKYNDRILATLRLTVDMRRLIQNKYIGLQFFQWSFYGIIFLLVLVSGMVVDIIVRRPIRKPALATSRLEQGKFTVGLSKIGNGVIGQLTTNFDSLQRETKRLRSELEYQKMVLDEHSVVSMANPAGDIIYANEKYCLSCGFSRNEVLGKNIFFNVNTESDGDTISSIMTGINDKKIWQGELCVVRRNGDLGYFESTVIPYIEGDGHLSKFLLVQTDVSKQDEAASKMRESNAQLKNFIDYSPTIMYRCDTVAYSRITYISENIRAVLGYYPEQVLNVECFIQTHTHKNDKQKVTASLSTIQKKNILQLEFRIIKASGEYCWVANKLHVIRDKEGKIVDLIGSMEDITLRKNAEEARKSMTEMLSKVQAIAHIGNIGSWEWDIASNKMKLSKEAYRIYGIVEQQFAGTYESYLELLPQTDRDKVSTLMDGVLLNQVKYDVEHSAIRPDGREVIVRERGVLYHDENNNPTTMIAVVNDVTKQKINESIEREYKNLLKGILDSLQTNIAVLDSNGVIINVNMAWDNFSTANNGSGNLDNVGVDYLAICKSAMADNVANASTIYHGIKDILERKRSLFSIEYPCHAPHLKRWFLMQVTPLLTEGGGAVVSHINITERVLAETALQKATDRLETLLDSNPTIIFCSEPTGDFTINYISDNVKYVLGYQSNEIVGHVDFWFEHIHPDDRSKIIESLPSLFDGEIYTHEYRFRHKDGRYLWMHNQMRSFSSNHKMEVIGSLTDISDRKNAEEELMLYRNKLQEMVDEQTRDLIEARDLALSAERSMSTFLANMSHELRTPLHGVLSYAGFGKQKHETATREKLNEYFNEIADSGNTLLSLVNNVLDLSKLRAGKMSYNYSKIDINIIIESVLHELSILADKKSIVFRFKRNEYVILNMLDGDRMAQVMRNLLSNAIKFSPQGGVIEVTVEMDEADNTIVTITDQGVGIPDNELDLIFQAFEQSSTTRTNAGGTGLGLPICKEIIEGGHKGSINAYNVHESGACFTFKLPLFMNTQLSLKSAT